MRLTAFKIIIGLMILSAEVHAETFITWVGSEPDKGASMWLIKHHIDPNAKFLFIAQDAIPPTTGILFDMPQAKLRRTHNQSTYEMLLHAYGVSDKRAQRLGRIIHDIEINRWRHKLMPQSNPLLVVFSRLQKRFGVDPIPLECQLFLFDAVAASLITDDAAITDIAMGEECSH